MTIKAKVIADSVSLSGKRITTLELEYPRFIHSEFMTHRMFSRNAASSRAIPINKMHELINNNPAMPLHWGVNKAGMSADAEIKETLLAKKRWKFAAYSAVINSELLQKLGLHKQVVNRITEPFQHIKTVVTATEFANFFELRDHKDAQPEIADLAAKMREAMKKSEPKVIREYEWHVPYVTSVRGNDNVLKYWADEETEIDVDQARKISASCCAQVSYRNSDSSLQKAEMIFDRLINSAPIHASPIEHQATPIPEFYHTKPNPSPWVLGVTSLDRKGQRWSGNFNGWIQYRQLFEQTKDQNRIMF